MTDHRGLGRGLANPVSAFWDVKFEVDKQTLNGHSVVINQRCPNLIAPKGAKKKPAKKKGTISVAVPASIDLKTLQEVLNYTYMGEIEFPKLDVPQILKLNAAAIELDIARLRWLCENYLRTNLSMENIFQVLKGAHNHKQKSVKEFCFHYILKNYNDFVGNKEGVKDLGIDLFQEVVEVYQESLAGAVKAPLVPNEPEDTLIEDYKRIYDKMPDPDVHFKVGEEFIACHKAILAAQSSELTDLCGLPMVAGKGKDGVEHIVLPGLKQLKEGKEGPVISPKAFHYFLKHIYYGETEIEPSAAVELIPWCKDFNLPQLQAICLEIAKKNINRDTCLDILAMTYLHQMDDKKEVAKELKEKSISFLLDNLADVELKPLRKLNPNIAIDILLARQQRGKSGGSTQKQDKEQKEETKSDKGEGKKDKEKEKEESSEEEEEESEESEEEEDSD